MSQRLSSSERRAIKESEFTSENSILPLHIGYFILWFGTCEGVITRILAHVLGFAKQAQRLEFVTRGLDAKAKCERVRQAAKLLMPLGPNLNARLLMFQEKMVPLRNRISHNWLVLENGTVHFTSLAKIHGDRSSHEPQIPSDPEKMLLDGLFDHAAWLQAFASDLLDALEASTHGEELEVKQPLSHPPKELQKAPAVKSRRANPDRRARKSRRTPK